MKILNNIDLNKNELQNARIQNLASAPSSPVEGQVYYDTVQYCMFVYSSAYGWTKVPPPSNTQPTTLTPASSGGAGVQSLFSRGDHGHALTANEAPANETIGATAVTGTSEHLARADHVHAMPGLATSGASGFMANTDKAKLDDATSAATASKLVLRDGSGRAQFADPSAAQDAATKAYVDASAQGLDAKGSVRAATTGALPAHTFDAGNNRLTASANGAIGSLDGVTLVLNDRVLVKDEGSGTHLENGIYYVELVGDASNPWKLKRTTDADSSAEVNSGLYVFVEEGTVNADSGWILITNNPITLNTTALSFTQFSGAGQIVAGLGLTKSGNTLNLAGGSNNQDGLTIGADTVVVNIDTAAGLKFDASTPKKIQVSQDAAGGLEFNAGAERIKLPTNHGLARDANGLALGTPSSVTASSTNAVTTTTHTHAADSTLARSAITITAGNGLTGGGDLTTNRTVDVGKGDGIAVAADAISADVDTTAGMTLTGTSPNKKIAASLDAAGALEFNSGAMRVKLNGTTLDRSTGGLKVADGGITDTQVAAANKDGSAGVASMRTLGTGAAQAAAGNHNHDGTYPKKYSANIGNGSSTTIAVTHNLGTSDIVWKVRQASTPYAEIITDAEVTDANTLTLKFAVAPATNEFRVTVVG